jgi:hypothetical protein
MMPPTTSTNFVFPRSNLERHLAELTPCLGTGEGTTAVAHRSQAQAARFTAGYPAVCLDSHTP